MNALNQSQTGQCVAKEGQITGICRELEKSIECTMKSASELTNRLNDICSPCPPSGQSGKEEPPSAVPLAEKLQQFNRSVRSIEAQIQDLIHRCQL